MAITVKFKTRNGENTNRSFQVNEGISVYGKFTGVTGVYEPFTFYRIEIYNSDNELLYYKEDNADLFGGYDGYFITPDIPQKMEVKVSAVYSISGSDYTSIPIASGDLSPDIAPIPESESTFLDYIPVIIIIFLGAFLYLTFLKQKI